MAAPIRNLADAGYGQITSTPARVLRKLGIKLTPTRGYKAKGRRR